MDLRGHVQRSIEKAERCESNVTQQVLDIIGMCGEGNRHLYNNLVQGDGIRCLEIGTYRGASTAAILCNNSLELVSVDFVKDSAIRDNFLENAKLFQGQSKFTFLNEDCFNLDRSRLPMFNVYIYDGEHQEIDHYRALNYYIGNMTSTFVYAVDDWNWDYVRNGTMKALQDLNLKILYTKELFSNINEPATPLKHGGCDARHWGNGCGVFILQKPS